MPNPWDDPSLKVVGEAAPWDDPSLKVVLKDSFESALQSNANQEAADTRIGIMATHDTPYSRKQAELQKAREAERQRIAKMRGMASANRARAEAMFGAPMGALVQGATDIGTGALESLGSSLLGAGSTLAARTGYPDMAINLAQKNKRMQEAVKQVQYVQPIAEAEVLATDPMWVKTLAQVPGGIASSIPMMATGMGAGYGGGKLTMTLLGKLGAAEKFAQGAAFTVGNLASAASEAKTEGDTVFMETVNELVAQGMKKDEAIKRSLVAADKVFNRNFTLLGASNFLTPSASFLKQALFGEAKAIGKQALKQSWAKVAGKNILGGMASEGLQEWTQAGISGQAKAQALGDDKATVWSEMQKEPAKIEGLVGLGIGGVTGGMEGGANVSAAPSVQPSVNIQEAMAQAIPQQQAPVEQAPAPVEQPQTQPEERSPYDVMDNLIEVETEIDTLSKQLAPMKPGSPKHVELSGQINNLVSMKEVLAKELSTYEQPSMEAQNALQVGSPAEVGTYQGGPEGVGQEQGGGIRQGIEGQGTPQASQAQEVTIKVDGKPYTITDPMDFSEIKAVQQQVKSEIEQIKNQPMTSEERKAAIAEVSKKVDEVKSDVVKFKNTRAAIRKHAKGGYATSGGFLEIGAAVIQDLMAMGMDTFQKFAQTVRAKLGPAATLKMLNQHNGMLNFYKESKNALAKSATQTQTRTEGGVSNGQPNGRVSREDGRAKGGNEYLERGLPIVGNGDSTIGTRGYDRAGEGTGTQRNVQEVSPVIGFLQPSNATFLKDFLGNFDESLGKAIEEAGTHWRIGYVEDALEDPKSDNFRFYAHDGNNGYATMWDDESGKKIGVVIDQPGYAPIFFIMQNLGDVAFVEYMTNGRENGKPGSASTMYRSIGDIARQFGKDKIRGYYINGAAASLPLVHDGAELVDYNDSFVVVEVPTKSVVDSMRDSEGVRSLIKAEMTKALAGKTDQASIDATKERIDELRGQSRIEYLSSGLNVFKVVDSALSAAGNKTISEQLGINWDTATTADYYKALLKAINGLGKTVQETAVRIKQKFRDVSMSHALKLAEFLHRGDEQKDVDEALKDFKSEKVKSDIAKDQAFKRTIGLVSGWLSRPAAIGIRNPKFKAFTEAVDKFMNTMNVQKNFAAGMKNAVSKMTNEQEKVDLAYVLAKGTLANDGEGKRFTPKELAGMGFSPEAIAAYNQIIATTTDYQSRLRNAAEEALKYASKSEKAEIQQMIKALHNEAYWPLERFGSFGITLRDKNTGKAVGFTLVDGEHRLKDGLKEVVTKETINAAVDQMSQQDPAVKDLLAKGELQVDDPVRMPDLSELLQGGSLVFDSAMADYINAGKKIDEETMKQLGELAGAAYIKRSLGQHLKNRKGTAGYSLDLDRVVDAIPGIYAKKIARLTHGDALAEAHKALDPNENKSDTRLYKFAEEMKRSIMNPGASNEFGNAALKYGYVKGLAGVVSSGFVNALQSYTMGLPVVGNFYGFNNATKSISKALATASGIVKWSTLKSLGELDATESGIYIHNAINRMYGKDAGLAGAIAKVLSKAAASGEMQPKFTQELFNQERDTLAGRVKSVTGTWVDVLGYTMAKPEEINRVTMLMVAAEMAVKHGVVHTNEDGSWELSKLKFDENGKLTDESAEDLSKFATLINDVTNFAGSRGKRSRLELALAKSKSGQLANIPLQFTSYPIQSAMTAHAIGIMNAAKASSVGGKIGGYSKPLVAQALVATAIGGPLASTFAVLLSSALKGFDMEEWDKWFGTGLTDDLTKAFKAFGFGDEDARKYAEKLKQGGVPGLVANISLKGALQPGLNMSGESAEAKIGRKFMGIVGADVVDALQGVQTMMDTDVAQGLRQAGKAIEPRFIKGIREGLSGEASFSGAKEPISKYESLLRILGFQPTRIAEMRDKSSTDFEMFAMMQGKLKDLKAKSKSEEDAAMAIELMQEWNQKHDDPRLQFKARDFRSVQTSMPSAERRLEELR